MERLNRLLSKLAKPFFNHAHWFLRIGLGVAFFYMDTENFP